MSTRPGGAVSHSRTGSRASISSADSMLPSHDSRSREEGSPSNGTDDSDERMIRNSVVVARVTIRGG